MKKLLVAPIIVATLGASSFALAGGPDDMNQPAAHNGSVVLGVDGGYVWGRALKAQPFDQSSLLGESSYTKDSATEKHYAFGGHVGYMYNVLPKLAIGAQAGYLYLGQTNVKASESLGPVSSSYNFKVNQQIVDLLATAQYNVYQGLGVFAQAGPAIVLQKDALDSTDATNAHDSKKIHKFEPMVGAGLSYNFDNVIVSVAYDHVFGKKPSTTDVTRNTDGSPKFTKNTYSSNIILGSVGYSLPV
jgi:hypothetical protein